MYPKYSSSSAPSPTQSDFSNNQPIAIGPDAICSTLGGGSDHYTRWVLSVITELAFLQLVSLRGAHLTSEPRRSCKQGIIQSANVGGNLFLVCSCWQPRVGLWHNDDKWVSGDLHHNDSVRSLHGDLVTQDVCHDDHVLWTWCWHLSGTSDWGL